MSVVEVTVTYEDAVRALRTAAERYPQRTNVSPLYTDDTGCHCLIGEALDVLDIEVPQFGCYTNAVDAHELATWHRAFSPDEAARKLFMAAQRLGDQHFRQHDGNQAWALTWAEVIAMLGQNFSGFG